MTLPQFTSILRASLLTTFLALPALAQQAPPPATSSPIQNGRQQQPSRGETESRLQQQGVGAPSQERDRELQDLNALSRQLLPPGSPVPAPEAEQRSRPQR
jgi:hypothetical protein